LETPGRARRPVLLDATLVCPEPGGDTAKRIAGNAVAAQQAPS
jgi:hypothetical protein